MLPRYFVEDHNRFEARHFLTQSEYGGDGGEERLCCCVPTSQGHLFFFVAVERTEIEILACDLDLTLEYRFRSLCYNKTEA